MSGKVYHVALDGTQTYVGRLVALDFATAEARIAAAYTSPTKGVTVELTADVDQWEELRKSISAIVESAPKPKPAYPGAGDPYDHTTRQRKRRRK